MTALMPNTTVRDLEMLLDCRQANYWCRFPGNLSLFPFTHDPMQGMFRNKSGIDCVGERGYGFVPHGGGFETNALKASCERVMSNSPRERAPMYFPAVFN